MFNFLATALWLNTLSVLTLRRRRGTRTSGLGSILYIFFPLIFEAEGTSKLRSNREVIHPLRASLALLRVSSRVSPSVMHPGRSGNSAQKPPSSALWTRRGYSIFISVLLVSTMLQVFLFSSLSSHEPEPLGSCSLSPGHGVIR